MRSSQFAPFAPRRWAAAIIPSLLVLALVAGCAPIQPAGDTVAVDAPGANITVNPSAGTVSVDAPDAAVTVDTTEGVVPLTL